MTEAHDNVSVQDSDTRDAQAAGVRSPDSTGGSTGQGKSRVPLMVGVVLLGVLLVGGIAGGIWWINFWRSPAYSLGQLANAVQHKNWEGVQKYVDVDSVMGTAVDAAMRKALEQDTSGFGALAAGLAQTMKPALIQQAKEGFKKSVEEGSSSATDTASFSDYFSAKRIKSTTYVGEEAIVTVAVPGESGKEFDLQLRMKRNGNYWRVIAIDNILDLPGGSTAPSEQTKSSQPAARTAGTREKPIPLGASARVGDWDVTVMKVADNANSAVNKANEFNEKPAAGNQYVMVTVQAKYVGDKSGTFWADSTVKFYGSSGNTFDTASVVAPNQLSDTGETFPNAAVEGNLVFAVPSAQIAGGSVIIEPSFSMDDNGRAFFALN